MDISCQGWAMLATGCLEQSKLTQLKDELSRFGSAILALSGGMDSSFLLTVSTSVFAPKNLLAVTFQHEAYSDEEGVFAAELCRKLDVQHRIINFKLLEAVPALQYNPENRCYICKKFLFAKLVELAESENFNVVMDGSNASDLLLHRPGRAAIKELGVYSPLESCGITKDEIRSCSADLGFEKPSKPCYMTRFSHNFHITEDMLHRIGWLERTIENQLGFQLLRVRYNGGSIKLETSAAEVEKLERERTKISTIIADAGFTGAFTAAVYNIS